MTHSASGSQSSSLWEIFRTVYADCPVSSIIERGVLYKAESVHMCRIWGFHSGGYEEYHDTLQWICVCVCKKVFQPVGFVLISIKYLICLILTKFSSSSFSHSPIHVKRNYTNFTKTVTYVQLNYQNNDKPYFVCTSNTSSINIGLYCSKGNYICW
jgi:hypothetical protein